MQVFGGLYLLFVLLGVATSQIQLTPRPSFYTSWKRHWSQSSNYDN